MTASAGGGRTATTLAWCAPELLTGGAKSTLSHMYAFGVFMWQLMTCLLPFDGAAPDLIAFQVKSGIRPAIPSPVPEGLPAAFVGHHHALLAAPPPSPPLSSTTAPPPAAHPLHCTAQHPSPTFPPPHTRSSLPPPMHHARHASRLRAAQLSCIKSGCSHGQLGRSIRQQLRQRAAAHAAAPAHRHASADRVFVHAPRASARRLETAQRVLRVQRSASMASS